MIQTKITKDIYHGDGTTRRFEVTFEYNTKNNIKQIDLYTCTYTTEEGVTKYNNDVTKITSNYDFEVVNDVTYAVYPSDAAVSDGATPMATGTAIIIMRNTPNEQLSTGQYTSDKVEKQLDRLTMVQQELQEQLDRAYQAPEYVDKVNKADFATVANDIDAVNTVAAITEDIDLVNANAENITTVAQNIEDVNATGQNIEDVNTVALNINDVSTVAGIASDVTQVAGISTAVSNVSDNSSDVTLVSDNMASVMTTANSITDVQTVAGIATDVSTVADNNTNVTAVAGNATNINTVANKINKVETVADNISSVNTVSTNISDITNVSDNMTTISEVSENMDDVIAAADAVELVLPHITEINNVSENINDIVTVASINSDVSTVATNSSDISSVADNATNINTVASNVSNIATTVSNMAAIIAAPTAATNAANSALNAATSATNAQKWAEGTDADVQPLGGTKSSKGWANRAQELVESIGTVMRYKGSVANYAALQAIQNPTLGDTYNVLDTGANYSWDGSAWDEIGSAVDLSAYRTAAQQDVIDATYLPLSGGTMTGNLYIQGSNNKLFGFKKTNSNTNIDIGWDWDNVDGSGAAFRSTDAPSGQGPGNFILFARSGGNTSQLIGTPAGSLTWKTNEVITTANVDGTTIKATNNILSADATVMTAMTGATSSVAGVKGVVPAPAAGDDSKFLKGDGTWANPTSSASSWGSITGDLEDQTDLQNELDSKAPAVLLSHFWSDHIINEMSYLRGDTFSWQSGDVYTAAYNHLVNDLTINVDTLYCWTRPSKEVYTTKENPSVGDNVYVITDGVVEFASTVNSISGDTLIPANMQAYHRYSDGDISDQTVPVTPQTETIGSYTITYYEADDGHKICLADQEPTIYNLFNEYGVAWYYILDTANVRFKLPRTQYAFVGLRDNAGKYVAESLPQHSHIDGFGGVNASASFGVADVAVAGNKNSQSGMVTNNHAITSGASHTAYQTNAPVQQRATQMYLYFYVGTFTKTAYQETAGLNAELFNDKADKDLSNVSNTSGLRKLIDVYKGNDGSWYKVFAEYDTSGNFVGNWCEQGGKITPASSNNHTDVILLVPFADTDYTPMAIAINDASYNYADKFVSVRAISTTVLTISERYISGNQICPIIWCACGYIS